jgi:hypothetical protein
MALTGRMAQRGGWQHQAARLALARTAVATTAIAAADQARHRAASDPVPGHFKPGDAESPRRLEASIELAQEPDWPRPKLVDREQELARTTAAAWLLNGRRETLAARAARAASADKQVAELQDELALARERIVLEENENHSLQISLDLTIGENLRLSNQLAELKREVQKLEQVQSQLIDDTNTLLKTCKGREAALAHAEEKLSSLAELFVQLESANRPKSRRTIGTTISQPQSELNVDKWLFAETDTPKKAL